MDSIDIRAPLIDLGVDSLIALDIRSWFIKSLGVEVPLLEILSGSTVSGIADYATEHLPPHISSGSASPDRLAAGSPLVPGENDRSTRSNSSTDNSISTDQIASNDDTLTPPLSPSIPEAGFSPDHYNSKSLRQLEAQVEGSTGGTLHLS